MADRLNDESIEGWLAGRKGWKRKEEKLTKEFRFPSFRDAIVFINRVASLADEMDHHPDIHISYSTAPIRQTDQTIVVPPGAIPAFVNMY